MKFYHSGLKSENAPVILLFPGTACQWKTNFDGVRNLLNQKFHVVSVSYDGFDKTEQSIFPDMLTETEKIESYIQKKFQGTVCCAYGCSMGGSFVSLLIQRGYIHIDHGIIGSSDLDQSGHISAGLQTAIVSNLFYKMFQTGKMPGIFKKRISQMPPERAACMNRLMEQMFSINKGSMHFIKKESIQNQFYSDLVTPVANHISVPDTTIHVFYAKKMGEKYLERYHQHFANPDIHVHDMEHEELLMCCPEQWVQEVEACCFGTDIS